MTKFIALETTILQINFAKLQNNSSFFILHYTFFINFAIHLFKEQKL